MKKPRHRKKGRVLSKECTVRFTHEEKALLKRAARLMNVSLSDFIVSSGLRVARSRIAASTRHH